MKKIFFLFVLIANVTIANCQDNESVRAMITGYSYGDTITLTDFLKLSELSLNNNEYSIVSFRLSFTDNNIVKDLKSNLNKFTDEMKNALRDIKNKKKNITLYIESIRIKTPQGKEISGGTFIYHLKIE